MSDGDLCRHPEGAAQSGVTELREPGLAAELTGLIGGEIETAVFEKLAMVSKPAQVAGFSKNGHGIDRADARQLAQPLIVRVAAKIYQDRHRWT